MPGHWAARSSDCRLDSWRLPLPFVCRTCRWRVAPGWLGQRAPMSGGLQYRKSAPSGAAQAAGSKVDWEAFDETLARVDPCFSDPRFDSLKHVLTVLSSKNPEQEVEEVCRGRQGCVRPADQRCCQSGSSGGFAAMVNLPARHTAPVHLTLCLPCACLCRLCSCGSSVPLLRSWWTAWWRGTMGASTSRSTTTPRSCASSQSPSCRWGAVGVLGAPERQDGGGEECCVISTRAGGMGGLKGGSALLKKAACSVSVELPALTRLASVLKGWSPHSCSSL